MFGCGSTLPHPRRFATNPPHEEDKEKTFDVHIGVVVDYITKREPNLMQAEFNDSQPIYRQLRDRVSAMILDGVLGDGDPLPSVRTVAAEYRVNPLTVLKGYQELASDGVVETRRGRGMFVNPGARAVLLGRRAAPVPRRTAGRRSPPPSAASASTTADAAGRHRRRKI